MIDIVVLVVVFVMLVVSSITDIKTREVPDWISYGGIIAGLGIRLLWSIGTGDYGIIIAGAIGFGIFLALALLMFYTGQWGGGDSKILMALGALFGIEFHLDHIAVAFFINAMLVGAVYGTVWSTALALRNRKKFSKEATRMSAKKDFRKLRMIVFIVSAALFVLGLLAPDVTKIPLIILALFLPVFLYLFVFVKAVEKCCMHKLVKPSELTEGDWVVKDIVVKGKKICGPKDLGIEKKQIRQLKALYQKGKIKKVLIKEGMPFIPSFLITLVITVIWGNAVLWVI